MQHQVKRFNVRAFVALILAAATLGLVVTGGRIHIHQGSLIVSDDHAWSDAHAILAALFATFSIWHIVLNRHALLKYAADWAAWPLSVSREAKAIGAVLAAIVLLFIVHAVHEH